MHKHYIDDEGGVHSGHWSGQVSQLSVRSQEGRGSSVRTLEVLESIFLLLPKVTDCEDDSTSGRDGGVSDEIPKSSQRDGSDMS